MRFFGPKKTRTKRAEELRPVPRVVRWFETLLRDRELLLRLGVCALGIVLTVLIVQAWRPPFPHRDGDRHNDGIVAEIDFQRLNSYETEQARREAEREVRLIFRNDPSALQELPGRLRANLSDFAKAEKVEDLPDVTRAAFGLTVADDSDMPTMHSEFQGLKAYVTRTDDGGDPIQRLTDIVQEKFLNPMKQSGVTDASALTEAGITPNMSIRVLPVGADVGEVQGEITFPSSIVLTDLLSENGSLGKELRTPAHEFFGFRTYLSKWLLANVRPTLKFDDEATKLAKRTARDAVKPRFEEYHLGDVLVAPGQVLDDELLGVLAAQHKAVNDQIGFTQTWSRVATVFALLVVLTFLIGYYVVRNEQTLVTNLPRLALFWLTMLTVVGLGRMLSFDPWRAEVLPLAVGAMVCAIAYNQALATFASLALCLIVSFSTRQSLGQVVSLMSVCAMCIASLSHVPSRATIIKVSLWSGLVYCAVSFGINIIQTTTFTDLWSGPGMLLDTLRGAGWCLAAGYLVAGSLPFIEEAYGVVTDISLAEMSHQSHPLLKELIERAPGTYNHSHAVATIGEAAARRIGANGLLVKVGAYFHDIGKMLKPQYFIENVRKGEENKHEQLAPAMSTLIIIGHVKDGVELAKQHNLPQQLIDFIEQHHGTTLVEYFYRAAAKKADQDADHRTDAEESRFRYPGPKPQTREAGVMMLADAVESASRALSEPTPASIENLVHKIALKKLMDGQFDECALTLKEIRMIEDSLIKSLIGINHGRIQYPGDDEKDADKRKGDGSEGGGGRKKSA